MKDKETLIAMAAGALLGVFGWTHLIGSSCPILSESPATTVRAFEKSPTIKIADEGLDAGKGDHYADPGDASKNKSEEYDGSYDTGCDDCAYGGEKIPLSHHHNDPETSNQPNEDSHVH